MRYAAVLAISTALVAWAAAVQADCTSRSIILPGRPLIVCITCCDEGGNCGTTCL